MRRPAAVRIVLSLTCALLGLSSVGRAAPAWEPVAGDLGRDRERVLLRVGIAYGVMQGSELEKMDPAKGVEAGIAVPVLGSISVTGSFALDRANVDGQVRQLLDQNLRADGRSGTVKGEVQTSRFRAGFRVDAYRESGWLFQPYFEGAAVFSAIRVTIDSVDGKAPKPVPVPGGEQLLDIGEFTDHEIGALGRAGVEYHVSSRLAVDLGGNVEIIEFQAGTNSIFSLDTGLAFRF